MVTELQAGFKKLDDLVLLFGKHRGKTPREVAKVDPGYIVWLRANVLSPPACTRELAQDCEDELTNQRSEER